MKNLAIRGHKTRGGEVIKILEMLGGKSYTSLPYQGDDIDRYYYINRVDNYINAEPVYRILVPRFQVFTLEEFLEKFPYRVGDKVKIAETGKIVSIEDMSWQNEKCEVVYETCYDNDCVAFYSAIELQPYKKETMENKPNLLQQLKEYFDNTPREVLEKEWNELSYLNEIGPTVNEYLECVKKYRQSNQYPKTYVECAKLLDCFGAAHIDGYKGELLDKFQELLICRDAYWKIAGEQLGLGKPWEPDWDNESEYMCTIVVHDNPRCYANCKGACSFLTFPTAEMRDAFYENFKDLIEKCKELL